MKKYKEKQVGFLVVKEKDDSMMDEIACEAKKIFDSIITKYKVSRKDKERLFLSANQMKLI